MKIDKFLSRYSPEYDYVCFDGKNPFSETEVKTMLKDLLQLAADNAEVESEKAIDETWYVIDKESILNILE